jgi:isochorismate synthase
MPTYAVTAATTETTDLAVAQLAAKDLAAWRAALAEGQRRVALANHPFLVSATWPVVRHDPLARFAALAQEEAFFWEQPDQQRALVGAGQAATIITSGAAAISEAAARWHDLCRDALILAPDVAPDRAAPVALGGFAFDPLRPHTARWAAFPDGALTVPQALWRYDGQSVTLTLNQMVGMGNTAHDAAQIAAISAEADQAVGLDNVAWQQLVQDTACQIRAGLYQKVVLARGEILDHATAFAIPQALAQLRGQYPSATVFALRRGGSVFLGATPERLAQVTQGQVVTMALAGSAPRGETLADDMAISRAFVRDAKVRQEHTIVVSSIRDGLAPLCTQLHVAEHPRLRKLHNVQHLETPINGVLLPERGILEAVGALHPTPAVGGFPRAAALAIIREREALDRGWYAGPLGWLDAQGNGEFVVALRSALVQGHQAMLFAGCGIMGDSDPASELAEARLKTRVMQRALADGE